MSKKGIRLDQLLVQKGLVASRQKAQALIMAGEVLVNGQTVTKAATAFAEEADVVLKEQPRYVSRGGDKLAGALAEFAVAVNGLVCLDVGASTGGFTDCLLQHGAARVYAFDVGTNQLDWRLRQDPRVIAKEGFNGRFLTSADMPEAPALAVIDVSFISLKLILPPVVQVLAPAGQIVALIKPQFEAGREQVGKGGVVRDPAVHEAVVKGVRDFAEQELGLICRGICQSPLRGPAGNVEFFGWWQKKVG